jgi:hypothetical protein
MRIIHSAVAVVGSALAISAPLHHAAFSVMHGHHRALAMHPDSLIVESVSGARCVVHLGQGRPALVGLTDQNHLSQLHAWLKALGHPDTSVTEIAIIALPGALSDSAKDSIRSDFNDHAGIRVLLDWGGSVVNHGGKLPTLPMVAVVGADGRMTPKGGLPDSAAVESIHDALAMAATDARKIAASVAAHGAPLPVVRCEQSVHSS